MSTELKACPFCGVQPEWIERTTPRKTWRGVQHPEEPECLLSGWQANVQDWNHRAALTDADGDALYHAEQLATYIAQPFATEKQLASARYHCDKLRDRLSAIGDAERLRSALERRDEYAAKCPVQKRYHDVCPRCKATSSDTCVTIAGADSAFVDEVRALLNPQAKEEMK